MEFYRKSFLITELEGRKIQLKKLNIEAHLKTLKYLIFLWTCWKIIEIILANSDPKQMKTMICLIYWIFSTTFYKSFRKISLVFLLLCKATFAPYRQHQIT